MVETNEVRSAVEHINGVVTESYNLADGILVSVPEAEAGKLFKAIRVNGFEAQTKRFGDTLISRIDAEESQGLGELFG